jgi:hypothetical protein
LPPNAYIAKYMPAPLKYLCLCLAGSLCFASVQAQQADSSTIGKKRSFAGKIFYGIKTSFGRDTTGRRESATVLNTEALMPFDGMIIRHINTRQLGFEMGITDSASSFVYFGTQLLNNTHVKSRRETILRNVYLKEGSPFNPYLAADNERHLRSIGFIQDSRIIVRQVAADSVDLIVVTKDLFAYSPYIGGISPFRQRFGLSNINVLGTGQRLAFTALHDTRRDPGFGYEVGYSYNNIAGSFFNAGITFGKITRNIYDRREDEESFLIQIDRPLVSQYKRIAGGLTIGKGRSLNLFPNYYGGDYYRYSYGIVDFWAGYNLGARKSLNDHVLHLKKFVAFRVFRNHFFETPYQVEANKYDQRFNSTDGALVSLSLFRQYFYKTRYIYGFGVTEDVPAGYSISFTTGWYKQLDLSRPYLGIDAYRYIVTRRGDIGGLFVRTGGFYHSGSLQDVGLLLGASYFSRVMNMQNIRVRQYFRASYSTIINRVALNPLRINNQLGLRNFSSDLAAGNSRIGLRSETFVFLEQKFFGFRLAPFAAADLSWLADSNNPADSSGFFMGIGGGIRTRNENLVFGTFELRGIILPRKLAGDNMFKISLAVNLQFRYNRSYVSKPDIVELNSDVTGDIY